MRALALIAAIVLGGCPHGITDADRDALQELRTTERALLLRAEELHRDHDIRLSDVDVLAKTIRTDLVKPWQDMRERFKLPERRIANDLKTTFVRYFDERQMAWESWAKWIEGDAWGQRDGVNHHWQERESNEAATKDRERIEAKLVALKLPPLAPMPLVPEVMLDPPAPNTTPGAAYLLVDRRVVLLDNTGFRTIADDIDTMDVLPDGTMWACSVWHIAHWDGTKTTDYQAKIPSKTCTAAPDGTLWVLDDRYFDKLPDQLGHFDGKTWKITKTSVGDVYEETTRLIADREGRLYAVNGGHGGGGEVIRVLDDKKWRTVDLPHGDGQLWLHHVLRGGDGNIWAVYQVTRGDRYPIGFGRLTPKGGEEVVFATDGSQIEDVYPSIDEKGAFTVLLPRNSRLAQATKQKQLPLPVAGQGGRADRGGAFAVDGSGRIWIDLLDGLSVIDKTKRTVYPRGSTELTNPVEAIAVTGAGPTLVPPGPIATRTITGQLEGGKVDLVLCADPVGYTCLPGRQHWKATTDAEGNFKFENVPRWSMEIMGEVGLSGERTWRTVSAKCCRDDADLGSVKFAPNAWIE